jgi:predicted secreted protein
MTTHRLVGPTSGEVARLVPGDSLEIRLTQMAGGGYLWAVADCPAMLHLSADRNEPGALPGASAQRVLTFEAVAAGSGTLTLLHARPWEDDVLDRVVVDVEVAV